MSSSSKEPSNAPRSPQARSFLKKPQRTAGTRGSQAVRGRRIVSGIIAAMSQNRFSRRAIELVAENRIRHAMEEGKFEDLPGFGKPIPDIDEPYDPMWWVKKWIKREKLGKALAGKIDKEWLK